MALYALLLPRTRKRSTFAIYVCRSFFVSFISYLLYFLRFGWCYFNLLVSLFLLSVLFQKAVVDLQGHMLKGRSMKLELSKVTLILTLF
jgi:hypothetical protein